ncbi:MAG: filamentous hemagglutinin N-terminal domain-containing protein [Pseudomonadota bacterium]
MRAVVTAFLATSVAAGASAQSIVVNGETATSVATRPDGRPLVSIAPPRRGVSVNGFTRFDVPEAGATLDNRANAAVIVNQVTGQTRSRLAGALEVDGARADIVIANPNGITVNGGSFVNTGAVTLATGVIDTDPAGDLALSVTGGDIEIDGDGLVAEVARLDLLTTELRSNGRVDLGDGTLTVMIGASESLISASGLQEVRASNDAEIVAALGSGSVMNAGSIRIVATGDGPGVRLAGAIGASDRFSLTADGKVSADGATIHASEVALRSVTDSVALLSSDITADGSLSIRGKSVSLRESAAASENGGTLVRSDDGDVSIDSSTLTGAQRSGSFVSVGAVTVRAEGDVHVTSRTRRTVLAGQAETPSLESGDFDVALFATETLSFDKADITSTGGIRMEADDGVTSTASDFETERGLFVLTNAVDATGETVDVSIADGSVTSPGLVRVDTGNVHFSAATGVEGTRQAIAAGRMELLARDGSITIDGTAVEVGFGRPLAEDEQALVATATTDIALRSLDADRLADLRIEGGAVLAAGGDFRNRSGALITSQDLVIDAGGAFLNETTAEKSDGLGEFHLSSRRESGRKWWTLFTHKKVTEVYEAGLGRLVAGDQRGFLSATDGAVIVTAERIHNRGGDISGTAVSFTASADVANDAILAGDLRLRTTCTLWCSSKGQSDVFRLDGRLVASEALKIEAGGMVTSKGGVFLGGTGLDFSAQSVALEDLPTPLLVRRPGTLGGLFQGDVNWVFPSVEGPARVIVPFGNLSVDALGAVELVGVDLSVEGEVTLPEQTIEMELSDRSPVGRERGGLF